MITIILVYLIISTVLCVFLGVVSYRCHKQNGDISLAHAHTLVEYQRYRDSTEDAVKDLKYINSLGAKKRKEIINRRSRERENKKNRRK